MLSCFSRTPLVSGLTAECAAAVTVGKVSGVIVSWFLVVSVGGVVVSSNLSTVGPEVGAGSIGVFKIGVQSTSSASASGSSIVAFAFGAGSVTLAVGG